MHFQYVLGFTLVTSGCFLAEASATPPRFKATEVPVLEFDPSSLCCEAEALGMGPGETILGTAGASTTSIGGRGFSWRIGEEPVDLTGDTFTRAMAIFMNDAGWIAGGAYNCPPSDGACDPRLFFVSPKGELIDIVPPENLAVVTAGFTENNQLLFDASEHAYLADPSGTIETLPVPAGAMFPSVYGITPDGSVIGGSAYVNSVGTPLRWVDGEVEVLPIPAGTTFSNTVRGFSVSPDGSMASAARNSGSMIEHAVRWNTAGEFAFLPEPVDATSTVAAYADEEVVAGFATIDESLHAVIWYLEADAVTGYSVAEIGPNMEFERIDRAGDLAVLVVLDTTFWTRSVRMLPLAGGDVVACEDLVVMGDLGIDSATGRVPVSAFTNRDSNAVVINVGSWQGTPFLLERLRAGDVDGNGVVDGADLSELLGAWGTSDARANLDGAGIVEGADLSILLGDWG